VLSNISAFHRWFAQSAALILLSSDELMSCAAGTNGCLDWRCRGFPPRCPGRMGWRARGSGSFATKLSRLDVCADRKIVRWYRRRVWALRHQTGVQYSAVEWTRDKVAVRNVVVPAPQPEPASRLKSARPWCQLFAKCREVSGIHECPEQRYYEVGLCGLGAKERGFVVVVYFQLTFGLLAVEVEDCQNCFLVLSLTSSCRYSPSVTMSLLSTPSTVSQSPTCMIARSLVYA